MNGDDQLAVQRHLRAAIGYLGLSMPTEAWNELEQIPAVYRASVEALKIRLEACRVMGKWDLMAEIAAHLHKTEPDDPGHPIDLAFAIRRVHGEDEAAAVLEQARPSFPKEALLPYNIACYRAVRGRVAEARQLLAEAFTLDASLRITSLDDPDLVNVWDSFS